MSYNPDKKYTEEEMQLALRQFINGTFNLNVPAQDNDADLVLARSIKELTDLRAWKEKARPFLESEYQSLKMRLESKDSDNTVHHSIRLECQMDLNLLTELLKEGE